MIDTNRDRIGHGAFWAKTPVRQLSSQSLWRSVGLRTDVADNRAWKDLWLYLLAARGRQVEDVPSTSLLVQHQDRLFVLSLAHVQVHWKKFIIRIK